MAENTDLNSQITDSVTQTNVKVLAEASAMAMGSLYQLGAHSLSICIENSVAGQQQAAILAQAVTSQCVAHMLNKTGGLVDGK